MGGANTERLETKLTHRDGAVWAKRGQGTLFAFAIALSLGALITFTAHNWVYLGTVWKLGLIAGLLIAASAVWILKGVDQKTAQIFGLAAQILIGVWMAAAAQLYQAPGVVGELLFRWAVFGLPFVLAARWAPHTALWAGIAFLALYMPGDTLLALTGDRAEWVQSLGGLGLAALAWRSAITNAPKYLPAWLAVLASVLWLAAGLDAIFDRPRTLWLALLLIAAFGGATVLQARGRLSLAASSLFAAGGMALLGALLGYAVTKGFSDDVGVLLLLTILFGGLTYALVLVFGRLRTHFRDPASETASDKSHDLSATPWYMDVFIAIGGIATAIVGGGVVFSLLALVFSATGSIEIAAMVIGFSVYAGALFLRRRASGLFLRYLLSTLLLMGGATAIGSTISFWDFNAALCGALMIGLGILPIALVQDRVLSIISAGVIGGGVILLSVEVFGSGREDLIGLAVFAALTIMSVALLLAWRRSVALAIAAVWLVMALVTESIMGAEGVMTESLIEQWQAAWPTVLARGVVVLGALAALRSGSLKDSLPNWPVLIVLTLIAMLLPAGAAPAILILLIGYGYGSRTLFLIGVLAAAVFLFWGYFDLRMTLMEISAAMAVSAAALFGIWFYSARLKSVEVAS